MTDNDLAIIIFGVIAGYWIVAKVLNRVWARPGDTRNTAAREDPTDRKPEQRKPNKTWNEVLGIPSSAGMEEIGHAYRRLMSQYHPDKVASLGPELRDLAESKSKDITCAYRDALRSRGVGR